MNAARAREHLGHAADATRETMARHHWRHHVYLAARRAGVDQETIAAWHDRVTRAYIAGESAWMVVAELILVAKRRAVELSADRERTGLRAVIRSARKAGQ